MKTFLATTAIVLTLTTSAIAGGGGHSNGPTYNDNSTTNAGGAGVGIGIGGSATQGQAQGQSLENNVNTGNSLALSTGAADCVVANPILSMPTTLCDNIKRMGALQGVGLGGAARSAAMYDPRMEAAIRANNIVLNTDGMLSYPPAPNGAFASCRINKATNELHVQPVRGASVEAATAQCMAASGF